MTPISGDDSLKLAKRHLERVQSSWDPPNWLDLSSYGLYALEAAVIAAAQRLAIPVKRTHVSKVEASRTLSKNHGLPDIGDLMQDLNEVRKSEAYGDVTTLQNLNAEDVASEVEIYIDAVERLPEQR